MDLKDLNKGQFILLIILLCFIVSIATSITTYSLLSEAPDTVKKPITQVVQKTVERIVEIEKNNAQLSKEEAELLKDLKALKPLIDKLAQEQDNSNSDTTTDLDPVNTTNKNTENTNPENPNTTETPNP